VGDMMLPHNPRTLRGVSCPEVRPARVLLAAAIEVRGEGAAEGALATSVVDTAPATPSFFFLYHSVSQTTRRGLFDRDSSF
jgi:hypothetical protein